MSGSAGVWSQGGSTRRPVSLLGRAAGSWREGLGGGAGRTGAHLGGPAAGHGLLGPQDPLYSAQLHGLNLCVRQGLQHVT